MDPLEAKMAELAARFAGRAGEERAALVQALANGDRSALRDRAHKLAGIAAMFGFPAIGEAALALELAAENGEDLETPTKALDVLLAGISLGD